MLRDALLIAPTAISFAQLLLELTPALGEKHTLWGPAPAVPDTTMGLVLVCVMHLIICDVRSNELQTQGFHLLRCCI